ncbi:NmrA family NAD(P)-binding protein [Burkholderia sp. Ac-20379]|uniref:NmrA family NAD(P)-binding protein n=1 Tax=Burkholderia sp. Ac-20379 TaxID=2703900 RepID=UPI00198076C6|nr:NmrA family NAD(P)-binding protein [Burkholderia sp. Ac-20379]MBN3723173.1 NmrA family NAD(P)-binding protein [Burkholderia sp. Ac-20379]
MYAVTGISGKVGGEVARALLAAGQPVRAVLRDAAKAARWAALGCEIAIAEIDDAAALTRAFSGATGVFLMTPPNYDPAPGFPETVATGAAVRTAIEAARPGKVVFLSTVGAHVEEPNLLNNSKMTEATLRTLSVPVGLLRAGWFMENAAWDVAAARTGVVPSFLQPLDHPIPMVATADIGRHAASMLREHWDGVRVVELEGPRRYSADDIAAGFAAALGHAVRMEPVPRDTWEALFRSQGMQHPLPRMRMVDGFNEGWIDFEGAGCEHRVGEVELDTVLAGLVAR